MAIDGRRRTFAFPLCLLAFSLPACQSLHRAADESVYADRAKTPGPVDCTEWTENSQETGWVPGQHLKTCGLESYDYCCEWLGLALQDHKNYYSCANLACLGIGVAVAAPLANTSADEDISDWYRRSIRSTETDNWSRDWKRCGDHWYVIPAAAGAMVVGKLADMYAPGSLLEEWGSRTSRALLVGAPSVGILQATLGGSRPRQGSSSWQPFNDNNGVSGHGFVGAVPILSAAMMCENKICRYSLMAVSVLPAWSRVNDDAHYLSQAALGWWIAYLSVKSVDRTERDRMWELVPACQGADGPGVTVAIQY